MFRQSYARGAGRSLSDCPVGASRHVLKDRRPAAVGGYDLLRVVVVLGLDLIADAGAHPFAE